MWSRVFFLLILSILFCPVCFFFRAAQTSAASYGFVQTPKPSPKPTPTPTDPNGPIGPNTGGPHFWVRAQIGTWKLNEAKSKLSSGAVKNNTVVYDVARDRVKVTIDGADRDGRATHNEWTGKFDGKDYPVIGDPDSDERSYKLVNDHTLDFVAKKLGKVTLSGRIVVAADGKSRTVTANGTRPQGDKFKSISVYDKQ